MYDLVVIGAGPAGMTAGIYAARKKLNSLVLGKDLGGQMAWSSDVENYTGFSMISGADLTLKFKEHIDSISDSLTFKTGIEVVSLEQNIHSFAVEDSNGNLYHSRAVIIASGKVPNRLNIPGEEKFFGKGVSVCATCDGPLYKGKTVAVIGGGNSALDAILSLSKSVREIVSINLNNDFVGEEIAIDKVRLIPNISFYKTTKVTAIEGAKKLTGIKIQQLGKRAMVIPVDAVFVEAGYMPSTEFDRLSEKNEQGEIKVDANMQTNVPGLFAAGDVNDAWGDQIIIAAGEGAKAAMAVANYLNKTK